MNPIKVRYGASLILTVETEDTTAVSATLYVGEEGQLPVITKTALFDNLIADVSLNPEDTEVPLGKYKYQIDVIYSDGRIDKFPNPKNCLQTKDLPDFSIHESLSDTEVS